MTTIKKGFTLIELLIVIGILAVLAAATVVILNPAELLKQSRDSNRIADMQALQNATDLYLADDPTNSLTAGSKCTSGTASKSGLGTPTACTAGCAAATCTAAERSNAGTGWIPVDYGGISSGAPFLRLPADPNNASTNCGAGAAACFYQYIFNASNQYEFNASMESAKFVGSTGPADVETTDGGDNTAAYEVGTNLAL